MKVLIDINVILDVWLVREPFWRDSASLIGKIEKKEIEGIVAPATITTLHCLGNKVLGEDKARQLLERLLVICKVGSISSKTFKQALKSKITDFEDAVIEAVSESSKVELIATRDIKDFRHSIIPAMEPSQILKGERIR